MNRLVVAAALLASAAVPLSAQMPDTPAGHALSGWLTAFDDVRPEPLRQFIEEHVAPDARHELLEVSPRTLDFRARVGGFDFRKTDSSTAAHLAVFVQERNSDRIARVTIDVEPSPPHRITKLKALLVPTPRDLAPPRLSDAELVAAIGKKLERDAESGQFSGAVLVAHDGRAVFEHAYGLADREKKIANTVETRFRIGSMNKMFTAVAVLQLAQAGKLQLDAPLGRYLTDYPNKDVATKVTIHHLLTHTGGTGDIFGPEFAAHRTELRTLDDYVKLYGARGLAFEPGSKWDYSNYGFILLGAVIEKVSGMSYYDYVASHVFTPAGMTSTGSLPEETNVPNRAVGYTKRETTDPWEPNTETLPYRGTSAGGGYSTVGDLLRFANALRVHTLLDSAHTELLTTGKVETGPGGKYAYGFGDRVVSGARLIGHNGGAPGMNGQLDIDPRSGYVVAVLANLDPPAAGIEADFIDNRLPIGGLTP